MKVYWLIPFLGVLGSMLPSHVIGQRWMLWRERPGTWLLSGGIGLTRYTGEMNELGDFSHLRLGAALNVGVNYRFSYRVSLRAEAQLYYIYGSHKNTRIDYNNLSFRSLNPDSWVGVQMDLWPVDHRTRYLIPYAFAGPGLTYMSPKATYKGQTYSLAPLHTEGVAYNRLPIIVRYGVGFPIQANERFLLHLEGSYTHVLSDYLDDVSTRYPDRAAMSPVAAALSDRRPEIGGTPNPPGAQRGNGGKNDGYFIVSVRGIYILKTEAQRKYRRSRRG